MIVDSHGHASLPEGIYAWKAGLLSHRGAHGKSAPKFSDDELRAALTSPTFGTVSHLEQLQDVGTDLQFVSPRPYQMMHSEQPHRLVNWYIEETNDLIARQCKLYPDTFRGICGLPQHPNGAPLDDAVRELERCVKEQGFIGCLLNPDPNEGVGTPPGLGDEYWYPLYAKLVELDVPALIHSASCRSPRESYTLHFIQEESVAIMSLLSSTVMQDFPTLKLIVSHGGGAIPYQVGRFEAARFRAGREPFLTSLRRLWFDTCLYSKEGLELLFKVVGPDRCLFGTERPGTGTAKDPRTGRWMDDVKAAIDSIEGLSAADRQRIYEDNTRAVYKF